MRGFLLLLLASAACGPRTKVLPEEAVVYSRYHRIGPAPFVDPRGKGKEIADAIEAAFQSELLYDPIDVKALAEVLDKNKPDKELGLGLEAIEAVRRLTSADAIVFGRMTKDWSGASITLVETDMGDPILHAVLRPRRGKAFQSPDEIARELTRVLRKLR